MAQANVDLGVLQETKLTDGVYTRWSSEYHVHATDAPSTQQGGVALTHRDTDLFQVEAVQTFGPNVISWQLVTGKRRWYVVGCYIPPTCTTTIEQVQQAIDHRPRP
jgi:exonuclease III